jgi:hypothetical protein
MKKEDKLLVMWTSAAIGTLVPVALYQLAVISHLPDPPSKVFASDDITASSMAHPFGIPDSLPGLCSYGTTLALVLAGDPQTQTHGRWIACSVEYFAAGYAVRQAVFVVYGDSILHRRDASLGTEAINASLEPGWLS